MTHRLVLPYAVWCWQDDCYQPENPYEACDFTLYSDNDQSTPLFRLHS
jgi:hypothetical protein